MHNNSNYGSPPNSGIVYTHTSTKKHTCINWHDTHSLTNIIMQSHLQRRVCTDTHSLLHTHTQINKIQDWLYWLPMDTTYKHKITHLHQLIHIRIPLQTRAIAPAAAASMHWHPLTHTLTKFNKQTSLHLHWLILSTLTLTNKQTLTLTLIHTCSAYAEREGDPEEINISARLSDMFVLPRGNYLIREHFSLDKNFAKPS